MPGDRVQFAIDIAAQMSGGDATEAELDQLSAKLMGGGRNAEHFQQAINRVSNQLDGARAATVAATSALSEGETKYAQMERAALKAAKAAERAAKKGGVNPALEAEAKAAAAALRGEAQALDALRGKARAAEDAENRLAKTHKNLNRLNKHVTDRLGDAATKLSTFRGALGDVGGPLGEFGEKLLFPVQAFVDVNEWFGKTAATATVLVVGLAAVTAAVVALGVAAAAAVVGIAALGVKIADNARAAGLAQEAFDALHPELRLATQQFGELEKMTGLGADRLRGLTTKLEGAKVSARDMPAALKAAALAEAALGQGGADQFIADMKEGKLAIQDFAAAADTKFGSIVERRMLGLEAQSARLRHNLGETFGGLKIEPLLEGLATLGRLFDQDTAAGQTMKFLFESIFQPIIDGVVKAIPLVEAFFLGILIGGLKIYIALKPVIRQIEDLFGFEDDTFLNLLTSSKEAGETFAFVLAGMATAFGVVLAAVLAFGAAIVAVPILIGKAIQAVVDFGLSVYNTIAGIDFHELGANMMRGLVEGISAGAQWVKDAVSGAVKNAIAAAKSLLGISSPSKVFAQLGEYTGEGFAGGVEDTSDKAQSALATLVEPPALRLPPSGSQATAPTQESKSGPAINLAGANFNFYGVEGAEDAETRLGAMLTRLLEGDVAQLGGAAP